MQQLVDLVEAAPAYVKSELLWQSKTNLGAYRFVGKSLGIMNE